MREETDGAEQLEQSEHDREHDEVGPHVAIVLHVQRLRQNVRLTHDDRADDEARDVDREHVVEQRTVGVHPCDQPGIDGGEPLAEGRRFGQGDREAGAEHQQRNADHQAALQHVRQHVRVGTANEHVARHEHERNRERLDVAEPEKRLHHYRDPADEQDDESERQQIHDGEEQRVAARPVALADPVRNRQRPARRADTAEAKRQDREHRHEPQPDADAHVEERAEPVDVDEARVDDERRGRRHAGRQRNADDVRAHRAIADRETAETRGLPEASPAQPGRAGQVQQKQDPGEAQRLPPASRSTTALTAPICAPSRVAYAEPV